MKSMLSVILVMMLCLLTGSAGAAHWTPPEVSPDQMHLAGSFLIEGLPAEVGDEVAVIDSEGAVVGVFVVTTSGQYGDMAIMGDSSFTVGIDEGAANGEELSIRVWDASASKEYGSESVHLVVPAAGTPPYLLPSLPLAYGADAFYLLDLEAEIDITPPVVEQVTGVPALTNNQKPAYTFSSTEAGTITYGGSCTGGTATALAGNNTVMLTGPAGADLAAGTYSDCTITVTDVGGNASNVLAINSFTVDTTAPVFSLTTPVTGSFINSVAAGYTLSETAGSGQVTFTWTGGSADNGSPYSYSFTAGELTAGAHTIAPGFVLVDGAVYTVSFEALDLAGNPAATVSNVQVSYDRTGPTVSIGSPSQLVTAVAPISYTVTYSGADTITLVAADVTLNKTGTANGTLGVSGTGSTRTVTISGISGDGALGISLKAGTASDLAGNSAGAAGPSATFIVENSTPPVITGGPIVSSLSRNSASIQWTTDEPATSAVYYGQSGALGLSLLDGGLVTAHSVLITGLEAGTTYYLEVASTDASNNTSLRSRQISFVTLQAPDTTAPHITEGPMALSITDTEATIIWRTDEPTTGTVSYKDGAVSGSLADPALSAVHMLRLTGLSPSKSYSYQVAATDVFGNGPTASSWLTFVTLAAPDVTPPVIIEGPIVVKAGQQSAAISWVTDEGADSAVEYGLTQALGRIVRSAELAQRHNMTFGGLKTDTTYYYRVLSADSEGNGPTASQIMSFRTGAVPDTTAPVITKGPELLYTTDTKVIMYWETDEPSDSVVTYGIGSSLSIRLADAAMVTQHRVTLVGLEPATSYSFAFSSTDPSGNTVIGGLQGGMARMAAALTMNGVAIANNGSGLTGFTTSAFPDTTPPAIVTGPEVTSLTDNMATIRWVTDEPADSRVNYGLQGSALTQYAGDIVQVVEHVVVLTNLTPGTTYSYQVGSVDPSENGPTSSAVFDFTTDEAPDSTGPAFSSGPSAADISLTQAVIQWGTDKPSTTQVSFGTDAGALNTQIAVPGLMKVHAATLTNLQPATTYYFVAISMDSSGNISQSAPVGSFRTLADTQKPTTTASLPAGTYAGAQSINLSCDDHGGSGCANTFYCLGAGCTPATNYSEAIMLSASNSLSYYSTDSQNNSGDVTTGAYTIVYELVVTPGGSGSGNVTSSPSGINCGGTCSALFDSVLTVDLAASTTDVCSYFKQWGGVCVGGGDHCSVSMSSDRTVAAVFDKHLGLKLERTGKEYASLQEAYDETEDNDVLKAGAAAFSEDLTFDGNGRIKLSGGYDCSFSTNAGGFTTIRSLSIGGPDSGNGGVTIENVTIK